MGYDVGHEIELLVGHIKRLGTTKGDEVEVVFKVSSGEI